MNQADIAKALCNDHGAGILITGGTGTFGRAFTRHLLEHGAQRVCIYSRGELAQSVMREEFAEHASRLRFFIGDVRDDARLETAMHGCTLVIHAAALKRVEVGEYNPVEMVQTNVDGTLNVIRAAWACTKRYGNHRPVHAVLLSSDKACAPVNTYGATKLVAEKLFLGAGHMYGPAGPIFTVTRYGNVAGSQGSVIPIWRRAIAKGQPIEVRGESNTRFWMTLAEAVHLVQVAASIDMTGAMLVPDLPAYTLGSLADALHPGFLRHYTLLGPGEKHHESMISADEAPEFFCPPMGDHFTLLDGYYVRPGPTEVAGWRANTSPIHGALHSHQVRQLTVPEIQQRLEDIPHG